MRGRVGRRGRRRRRRRRLGGVGGRTRACDRIFRGAGGTRRGGRAGGRRAKRDQPQQRHAPPPEHGGQRAGSAPDAARGPLATEIRAPSSVREPESSPCHPDIRAAASRRLAGDAGARARPHGDWSASPESSRPHPNTISGATLRAATAARPPHAANFTRNCGRAVMRYVCTAARHLHRHRHHRASAWPMLAILIDYYQKIFLMKRMRKVGRLSRKSCAICLLKIEDERAAGPCQ